MVEIKRNKLNEMWVVTDFSEGTKVKVTVIQNGQATQGIVVRNTIWGLHVPLDKNDQIKLSCVGGETVTVEKITTDQDGKSGES